MSDPVVYQSTDASAPVLTGQAASFKGLIKAICVGTAGVAYGAKASLGWTSVYEDTNKLVIRSADAASPKPYLRFDDTGSGTGGARQCFVRGYAAMTNIDTGTGPFPSVAQSTPGIVVRKSATADSTARAWIIVADGRGMHVFIDHGASAGNYDHWYFGDITSAIPSDAYGALVGGRTLDESSASASNPTYLCTLRPALTEANGSRGSAWLMASIDGATASLECSAIGVFGQALSAVNAAMSGAMSVPLAAGVVAARTLVQERQSPWYMRGSVRGMWHSLNSNATRPATGDIVGNLGNAGSRQGVVVRIFGPSGFGSTGWVIVQTTDWDV